MCDSVFCEEAMIVEYNQVEIFESSDGEISLEVHFIDDTVWLTQRQMADLFDRDRVTITRHLSSIFKEGELEKTSVCSNFEHTATDNKKYIIQYYNLDVKKCLWELLHTLNRIRNKFAHILETSSVELEINDFMRLCIL